MSDRIHSAILLGLPALLDGLIVAFFVIHLVEGK